MSNVRVARMVVGGAVLALATAAPAAPNPPNYEGKVGTGTFGLHVKLGRSGKPLRIQAVEWDGYPCGGDHFTGGSTKSIKIRPDRRFKSTQRVGGIDKALNFTIQGRFTKDGRNVSGTIKVETCTGTKKFSARKYVES